MPDTVLPALTICTNFILLKPHKVNIINSFYRTEALGQVGFQPGWAGSRTHLNSYLTWRDSNQFQSEIINLAKDAGFQELFQRLVWTESKIENKKGSGRVRPNWGRKDSQSPRRIREANYLPIKGKVRTSRQWIKPSNIFAEMTVFMRIIWMSRLKWKWPHLAIIVWSENLPPLIKWQDLNHFFFRSQNWYAIAK